MKFYINCVAVILCTITILYPRDHYISSLQKNNCITTQKIFKKDINNAVIEGVVLDCKTQKPLKAAIIKINKKTFYSDTLGRFRHQIKPGNYTIKAGWPTYLWKEINTTVKNKDSLFVTFYLKDDPEPLN